MKKLGIAAMVFTGTVLGLGVGATAQPPPEVRTETVEKKVEVEVPVEKVVEKEVEVVKEVTPTACLDSIAAAENIARKVGEFSDISSNYPPLIAEAFEAGLDQDLDYADDILIRLEGLNLEVRGVTDEIAPLVEEFNRTKAICRK